MHYFLCVYNYTYFIHIYSFETNLNISYILYIVYIMWICAYSTFNGESNWQTHSFYEEACEKISHTPCWSVKNQSAVPLKPGKKPVKCPFNMLIRHLIRMVFEPTRNAEGGREGPGPSPPKKVIHVPHKTFQRPCAF